TNTATGIDDVFVLKLIQQSKKRLDKLVEELKAKKIKVIAELKFGGLFKHVAARIDSKTCDMVVMGTKGSNGLQEFMMGSNAEKVVRTVNTPVITVRKPVKSKDIRNVVIATNFELIPTSVVNSIKKMQDWFDFNVVIANVNTPHLFHSSHDAIAKLKEIAKKADFANTEVVVYNDYNEETGIVNLGADYKADLIILGTHQRKGLKRLLYPSVAAYLVNHSDLPVMTYLI
ncbi:universal stress protein, partial [bacterium]|nr:universal stress protein [bacterium]